MILRIPQIKQASMTWKHPSLLQAKKVQSMPSVGKIMVNVFWDHKDVLIVNSLDNDSTAATECYCGTLKTLWQVTITKSLGCYAKPSLCMVTTTRTVPHYRSTCGRSQGTLPTISLPCSASLQSWNHHKHLTGIQFIADADMHHADISWLQTVDITFFCARI
jgi:hypothetical protein